MTTTTHVTEESLRDSLPYSRSYLFAFDPTADDDSADTSGNGEFRLGDGWMNSSTGDSYVCLDASEGAADWRKVIKVNEDGDIEGIFIPRSGLQSEIDGIVLEDGEIAFTTDTYEIRLGDGIAAGGHQVLTTVFYEKVTFVDPNETVTVSGVSSGTSATGIAGSLSDSIVREDAVRVYAYRQLGSERAYSSSYQELRHVSAGDGGATFGVQFLWDPVEGADGYRLLGDTYFPSLPFHTGDFLVGLDTSSTGFTITSGNIQSGSNGFSSSNAAVTPNSYVDHVGVNAESDIDVADGYAYRSAGYTVLRRQSSNRAMLLGDLSGTSRGQDSIDFQMSRTSADNAPLGANSLTFGYDNRLDSQTSMAIGGANRSRRQRDIVIGYSNNIDNSSTALAAQGDAIIIGADNDGTGSPDIVIGYNNTANALLTSGTANRNTTVGANNLLGGQGTTIIGNNSRSAMYLNAIFGYTASYNGHSQSAALGSGKNNYVNANGQGVGINTANYSASTVGLVVDGKTVVVDRDSLGAELVTNGTFTGSATGWTLGTGWAYSSNTASKNANGTGTCSQSVPIQAGKAYLVTCSYTATVGRMTVSMGGVTANVFRDSAGPGSLNDSFFDTAMIIVAQSSANLTFTPSATADRFVLDNVSVKEITGGELFTRSNLFVGGLLASTYAVKIGADGSVDATGGFGASIVTKSANYSASSTDFTIIADATSAGVTITLPSPSSVPRKVYNVKRKDSVVINSVTVAASNIDGSSTYLLPAQYDRVSLQSDGTVYWVI